MLAVSLIFMTSLSRGTVLVICLACGANDCIWSSWCHCHPIISCCSKIQNGLPFWCRLTQVVLEKRLLNGCSVVVSRHLWTLNMATLLLKASRKEQCSVNRFLSAKRLSANAIHCECILYGNKCFMRPAVFCTFGVRSLLTVEKVLLMWNVLAVLLFRWVMQCLNLSILLYSLTSTCCNRWDKCLNEFWWCTENETLMFDV